MIDLTPLDVRKKKGDFRRGIRGYESQHVDDFLDIVADRLEALVREHHALAERSARLEEQVKSHLDREKALTDALVTAQTMREEVRAQSQRESEMLLRQAEQDAARIRSEADQIRVREEQSLHGLRSRQLQFLAGYRAFLEQELNELGAVARAIEIQTASAASQTRPTVPPQVAPAPAAAPGRLTAPGPAAPDPPVPIPVSTAAPSTVRPSEPAPVTPHAFAPPAGPPPSRPTPHPVAPPRPKVADIDHDIDARVANAFMEWQDPTDTPAHGPEADLLLSDDDVVASQPDDAAAEDPAEFDDFEELDLETPMFGLPASLQPETRDAALEADDDPALEILDDPEEELAPSTLNSEDDAWSLFARSVGDVASMDAQAARELPADEAAAHDGAGDADFAETASGSDADVVVAHGHSEAAAEREQPDISAAFGDHEPTGNELIDLDDFEALRDRAFRENDDETHKRDFMGSFGLTLRNAFGMGSDETGSGEGNRDRRTLP